MFLKRKEVAMRHVNVLTALFVIFSAVPALAQGDTVTAETKQLHALIGVSQAPASLSDKELAAVEGQGITLANDHATPGGTFSNPGTANAAGSAIPSSVFSSTVGPQWFGRAAGK
jgi:hypothetical protein